MNMRLFLIFTTFFITAASFSQPAPDSLKSLGKEYRTKGQLDSALFYYSLSEALYLTQGDSLEYAHVVSYKAAVEGLQGNYTESFSLYIKAASIYSRLNHYQGVIKSYVNIANQYLRIESFRDALEYYLRAKEFADELDFNKYDGYIYNGLGSVLSNRNNPERDLSKAKSYYDEALTFFLTYNDQQNVARIYNNLAIIYDEQGRNDLALQAYEEYLKIGQKIENPFIQLKAHHNLGQIFLQLSEYSKSLEHLKNAEDIAEEIPDPVNYIHVLANLVDVYISLGEIEKSRQHLEKYKKLRDSLYNEEKMEALSELQVKYKTKEKEALLAKEIELSSERRKKNFYLTGLAGLLFIAIVTIVWLNKKRRVHELERIGKERELESFKATVEGEERERQRLAKDLHDSVGGVLTAVRMIHSSYKGHVGEKAEKVDHLLQEASDTVRKVSHNLSTNALERYGLEKSIEHFVKNLPDNLEVNYSISSSDDLLSKEVEKSLDFIIKELVNNTIKHANAQTIEIELNSYNGSVLLTYEDDGVGFNLKEGREGLGLANIHNRVKLLGGKLEMNSVEGEGFLCSIEIVIDRKD